MGNVLSFSLLLSPSFLHFLLWEAFLDGSLLTHFQLDPMRSLASQQTRSVTESKFRGSVFVFRKQPGLWPLATMSWYFLWIVLLLMGSRLGAG